MKRVILSMIRFYQKSWLVRVPIFGEGMCRFSPTCSEYTYQAIEKYGILRGSLLGFRRIIRCHPWNKGGQDLVP